ncbi:MAG: hypothetical protein FJY83_11725 [Candidatus Aminicenantes bacterium]|nr:hypothetical protein [Candidatus Aminicenantes bacterium]
MKSRNTAWVLIVLLCAPFAGPRARAQEPPPGHALRSHENLITFKLMRMTQVLELTEEQTAKIFPAFTRFEREKYEVSKKLNDRMRALRTLLQEAGQDEAKMNSVIEEIGSLRLEIRNKDQEAEKFLRSELSVRQFGRYTLFLVDFNRSLEEKLGRARMMRESPAGKRTTERRGPGDPL